MSLRLFFIVFLLPSVAFAEQVGVMEYLLVTHKDVKGCYEPEVPETCTVKLSWAYTIIPTIEQAKREVWKKERWFRVDTDPYRGVYWVPTTALVQRKTLKRFSGKWPVRYLTYDTGDARSKITFSTNGDAHVRTNMVSTKSELYIGGSGRNSVVELRYSVDTDVRTLMIAGYDAIDGVLLPSDYMPGERFIQLKFSDPIRPIYDNEGRCIVDCPQKNK